MRDWHTIAIAASAILCGIFRVGGCMAQAQGYAPWLPAMMAQQQANNSGGDNDPGPPDIAWYRFEAGAYTTDSAGSGRTLTNDGTTQVNDGTRGYCAENDGLSHGTVNSDSLYRTSPLALDWPATIVCWVRLDSLVASGPTQVLLADWIWSGDQRALLFRVLSDGRVSFVTYPSGSSMGVTTATSTGSIAAGSWVHLAVSVSAAGSASIYIGGAHDSTTTGMADPFDSAGVMSVGGQRDSSLNGYNPVDGLLDEVGIYSWALTASEIEHLATQ